MVNFSHVYWHLLGITQITALNTLNWWHSEGLSQNVGATFGLCFPPLDHVRDHMGGGRVVVEGGAQGAHRLEKKKIGK